MLSVLEYDRDSSTETIYPIKDELSFRKVFGYRNPERTSLMSLVDNEWFGNTTALYLARDRRPIIVVRGQYTLEQFQDLSMSDEYKLFIPVSSWTFTVSHTGVRPHPHMPDTVVESVGDLANYIASIADPDVMSRKRAYNRIVARCLRHAQRVLGEGHENDCVPEDEMLGEDKPTFIFTGYELGRKDLHMVEVTPVRPYGLSSAIEVCYGLR